MRNSELGHAVCFLCKQFWLRKPSRGGVKVNDGAISAAEFSDFIHQRGTAFAFVLPQESTKGHTP
jgi:hypothetical protein